MPYVAVFALGAIGIFLVRNPRTALFGALGLGALVFGLLAWFAQGHRMHLAPGDGLRGLVPLVAFLAFAFAFAAFAYTVIPRAPRGEGVLDEIGSRSSVSIQGPASTVWLVVRGNVNPRSTTAANYFLGVRHAGGVERVSGSFAPRAGGPLPERHLLNQLHGPGEYSVTLSSVSEALRLPLRVSVHDRIYSFGQIASVFAALALLVLVIDVMLRKRNVETSVAAALLLPLAASLYLQLRPIGDNLGSELLAALAVGALVGGLGGEFVARILNAVTGK